MKSYMKYTLKNSLLSYTVMQKWSFSVIKFMLKCLRSCPSKIIESGRVVIYAAYYTCSNVDLNLILVAARTSGFIFQIIDSLMASRGYTWPGMTVYLKDIQNTQMKKDKAFQVHSMYTVCCCCWCVLFICVIYTFFIRNNLWFGMYRISGTPLCNLGKVGLE